MGAIKTYYKELNCNDLIALRITDLLSDWSGVMLGETPGDLFSVSSVADLWIRICKQKQTKHAKKKREKCLLAYLQFVVVNLQIHFYRPIIYSDNSAKWVLTNM